MSIEQYFKKKISNKDMDEIDDNEFNVIDSDLEETNTNINTYLEILYNNNISKAF